MKKEARRVKAGERRRKKSYEEAEEDSEKATILKIVRDITVFTCALENLPTKEVTNE